MIVFVVFASYFEIHCISLFFVLCVCNVMSSLLPAAMPFWRCTFRDKTLMQSCVWYIFYLFFYSQMEVWMCWTWTCLKAQWRHSRLRGVFEEWCASVSTGRSGFLRWSTTWWKLQCILRVAGSWLANVDIVCWVSLFLRVVSLFECPVSTHQMLDIRLWYFWSLIVFLMDSFYRTLWYVCVCVELLGASSSRYGCDRDCPVFVCLLVSSCWSSLSLLFFNLPSSLPGPFQGHHIFPRKTHNHAVNCC